MDSRKGSSPQAETRTAARAQPRAGPARHGGPDAPTRYQSGDDLIRMAAAARCRPRSRTWQRQRKRGQHRSNSRPGDGAVIIREDGSYNLFMPDKPLDMALSFKHLMMMGFALGLGNRGQADAQGARDNPERGAATPHRRARNRESARRQRRGPRRARGVKMKADLRPHRRQVLSFIARPKDFRARRCTNL